MWSVPNVSRAFNGAWALVEGRRFTVCFEHMCIANDSEVAVDGICTLCRAPCFIEWLFTFADSGSPRLRPKVALKCVAVWIRTDTLSKDSRKLNDNFVEM